MAYTSSQDYAKYLVKKHSSSQSESGWSSCGESSESECGCCPPGLVNVYDVEGNPQGCITPNDAELLFKNTIKCESGHIKVIDVDGNFLGCFTPTEFATYQQALA